MQITSYTSSYSPVIYVKPPAVLLAHQAQGIGMKRLLGCLAIVLFSACSHASPESNPVPSSAEGLDNPREYLIIVLGVHVLPNGRADQAKVMRSSGNIIYDSQMVKESLNGLYTPTLEDNKPVTAWQEIQMRKKRTEFGDGLPSTKKPAQGRL